jgi:protein-disulfide isomerase
VLAIAAPTLWGQHVAGKLPRVIAEEIARTPKGEVTIVDFVDFECPFCRQMQEKLGPMVEAQKGKIRLVRKMVPLTRIHPHALAAAKAECCAEMLGMGDAMADALFETKVEDLTPEGCARLAAALGVPADRYNACLVSPDTDARLTKDRHEFDEAAVKGDGLPLMWVDSHKLMGAQDDATLSHVLGEALARAGS